MATGNCQEEYKLTIKLYKANYGDYLYWSVECDIPYNNSTEHKLSHPFRKLGNLQFADHVSGIVADNEMIRIMVKYLAMEDDELIKYTGNTSVVCYRCKIIASLAQFWD